MTPRDRECLEYRVGRAERPVKTAIPASEWARRLLKGAGRALDGDKRALEEGKSRGGG